MKNDIACNIIVLGRKRDLTTPYIALNKYCTIVAVSTNFCIFFFFWKKNMVSLTIKLIEESLLM